jgi:hypothetical protein
MDNIRIIFEQDNTITTLIVRSKTGSKPISNNYNIIPQIPINSTLDLLGLERVPFCELVPKYKQIKIGDNIIGQTCSICIDEYKTKEYKRELDCKHMFHKKCIDKWLKTHLTCPCCRNDITGLEELKIKPA